MKRVSKDVFYNHIYKFRSLGFDIVSIGAINENDYDCNVYIIKKNKETNIEYLEKIGYYDPAIEPYELTRFFISN